MYYFYNSENKVTCACADYVQGMGECIVADFRPFGNLIVVDGALKYANVDEEKKYQYDQKFVNLNAYYEPKFDAYKSAYLGALMDDLEGNEAPIMSDYQKLLEEYKQAIKAIEDGTDTVQNVQYNEYCPNCGTLLIVNVCHNCGWRA